MPHIRTSRQAFFNATKQQNTFPSHHNHPPRPPLALQGLKLLPIPNLRAVPILLPTCVTLVAWNVVAGLNVSIRSPPPPGRITSWSGGEDGGSGGGGLERNVYGFENEGAVVTSCSSRFVVVGFVVKGVVRNLKFGSWIGFVGGIAFRCGSREDTFEMSFSGLET